MDADEREPNIPLSEQAAHWWVVLHGDVVTGAEKQAFAHWVKRSPERIEAYLRIVRLMKALESARGNWPDVPADLLVHDARAAGGDVRSLGGGRTREAGRGTSGRWTVALAAALTLAIAFGAWWLLAPERYSTTVGEQRSVLLDDGSLVTLNTSSAIQVDYDRSRRFVRLLSGEALFTVAPDPERPFEVSAGEAHIRALGTQFNVAVRPAHTTVIVIEGRVIVEPAQRSQEPGAQQGGAYLAAAESIVVTDKGPGVPARVANVTPVTAWTQRRLIFERRPLAEVAEEFNRYNRRRLEIADESLASQEVTGVFRANDPDSFLDFLEQTPGVRIEQTASGGWRVMR